MKVRYAPTINSSPKGPDSRPGFIGSPVKPKISLPVKNCSKVSNETMKSIISVN